MTILWSQLFFGRTSNVRGPVGG